MQGFRDESEDIDRFFAEPAENLDGDIMPLLYLIRKELRVITRFGDYAFPASRRHC